MCEKLHVKRKMRVLAHLAKNKQTEDGLAQINLTAIDGTVWLAQDEIADLFDKGRSTVTEHIQNILTDGELDENSVCRNFRRTAKDGKDYSVLHYNLDMILAVGFRVRSPRGTQFRRCTCKISLAICARTRI